MISALRAVAVSHLRSVGFRGSFPHFRRPTSSRIDLLTFQFDRHGGGFVVEIATSPSEGVTMHWGEHRPPETVTAHDIDPAHRQRLGSGKKGDDHWFRYEPQAAKNPEVFHQVAAEVVRLVNDQAERWWREA
jgi:Domain of unknown function (DUF4304)